jgi:Rps23 Pro-64 3,4-dihydroxylase Tpa1-like proline 4-hydroxylase
MIFQYYEIKKNPVIVIDNFYRNESCKQIWQEICFLNLSKKFFRDSTRSGSATDPTSNKILKENQSIFLKNIYADPSFSIIFKESRKLFDREFLDKLESYNLFYRYLKNSNAESILLSYYDSNDYYKSHYDSATVSILSWFFQEPKCFSGGNLIIEDELIIECKYNRTVIFPSILYHSVSDIKLDNTITDKNLGRYTITHFLSTNVD